MEQKVNQILKKLTLPYVITLFVLVAFLVYGNTLFNEFVADDKDYIVNDPITHSINVALSFGMNNFNIAGQYRPLSALYFSLLYTFFATSPFLYHFLQILLHVACATLLYVLFRKFLSSGIALFLALVFLIHPMQVESVSFISQTVNPLLFLFGIIPLLYIYIRKSIPTRSLTLISSILLLSLLTKETGILFLVLLLVYSFLFDRNNLFKLSIGGFIAFVVYACIRFFIGHVGFETRLLVPIASLSLPERLFHTPIIMFYYLKTFLFPKTLTFDQQWVISSIDFSSFYLPLTVDFMFFTLICFAGIYLFKRHKHDIKPFLFFSTWFVLGLFFHLQIFPLDRTVSDRWFYFPMAGLLGLLGLLYQNLAKKLPRYETISLVLSALIIFPLAVRTIVRNSDWQNEMKLYSHDVQLSHSYYIENSLGIEYTRLREYNKALQHFQRSVALRPFEVNLYHLGLTYENMGNIQQARTYYEMSLHAKNYNLFLSHKHAANSYLNYAAILVYYGDSPSAVSFIHDALSDYPNSSDLWFLLALAYYKQHDKQGALNAAYKAYQLNLDEKDTYIYNQIQNNEPIRISHNGRLFIFNP